MTCTDRAPHGRGDKGEESRRDHLLLRQFITTLCPSASDINIHIELLHQDTNKWTHLVLGFLSPQIPRKS